MAPKRNPNLQPATIHYRELRRTIGLLGMFFPFIVALGGKAFFCLSLKPSLSQYYYSDMRDVFVGLLFAIGVFLSAYRGYELRDRYIGPAAGVFAVGIALFPMPFSDALPCPHPWASYVHYAFATAFFIVLIYFSLFEFTRTSGAWTPQKRIRNGIYRACGWIMIVCLIGMILNFIIEAADFEPLKTWLAAINPIFWGEAISIFFFGVSWLVKGETVFRDR
ncbi:MAG TPA: DUF998 domain-containing protein [Gammaproteobacteria bacterium]|nr:DUF998 domain-containing protein [Gammaproteobacteria bacterium]